jgi:hypothetical protein
MSSIPTYNFPDHIKGDSFTARQITFSLDLSGASINMQFKENPYSPMVYFWSTDDNSITIDSTSSSASTITMTTKILDVPATTYVYDIQIKYPDNIVKTYFTGSQKIIQDITT